MEKILDKVLTELDLITYIYNTNKRAFLQKTMSVNTLTALRELTKITDMLDEHNIYYGVDANYNIVLA